tara:strand:- start:230 stop:505 length:276 start_codon:yes stop_codon:yes gene_type:complete
MSDPAERCVEWQTSMGNLRKVVEPKNTDGLNDSQLCTYVRCMAKLDDSDVENVILHMPELKQAVQAVDVVDTRTVCVSISTDGTGLVRISH